MQQGLVFSPDLLPWAYPTRSGATQPKAYEAGFPPDGGPQTPCPPSVLPHPRCAHLLAFRTFGGLSRVGTTSPCTVLDPVMATGSAEGLRFRAAPSLAKNNL